ncbi:MAG: hypothetical protein ABI833_12670 [Acidobacteriota bacterium]
MTGWVAEHQTIVPLGENTAQSRASKPGRMDNYLSKPTRARTLLEKIARLTTAGYGA